MIVFVPILFVFWIQPALAQSGQLLEDAAKAWNQRNPDGPVTSPIKFDRITPQGELFVFEKFNPASFIILLQGSDGSTVMGYSFGNLFFGGDSLAAQQPALLNALQGAAKHYSGRIKGVRSFSEQTGPLTQTLWGQGKRFNYFCPRDAKGPNGRVYNGCVAVAMGQILRYFGGCNQVKLNHGYQSGYYGYLSASIGPYDWSAMEDSPLTISLEISDLLFDLGVLTEMNYSAFGSTTNSYRTLEAFHRLGYVNAVILRKSKFTLESWTEIFYQNIYEYRPVLVTGGGHAFVCDGYNTDGLFHFNMGWDGYGDGYYPLTGVMNLPVSEAFTQLEPSSWPEPPERLTRTESGGEALIHWTYPVDHRPGSSRVYVDDHLEFELVDTLIRASQLKPGLHKVFISAVYPEGESRWIGPEIVFVPGKPLVIEDPNLYRAFQKSLGYGPSDTKELRINEGDLSLITSLEIDQSVTSMERLDLCNHLKRLIILGPSGPALDARPLEDLKNLTILEWNYRPIQNPQYLGTLKRLSELAIRKTEVSSFDFLSNCKQLIKFELTDTPAGNLDILGELSMIDDLVVRGAGLKDAGFALQMPQLIRLDFSGNQLSHTDFLLNTPNLRYADLSDNSITALQLTNDLNSLIHLDLSHNKIQTIQASIELTALEELNLSGNQLVTPGRLFLYTPVLKILDLSNNKLRDLGKQRSQKLQELRVRNNQLISTDWISLQPSLKKLDLAYNGISDLSGLVRNNLYRQLDYLGLEHNPISKQAFLEVIPVLLSGIDTVSRPETYQPLSPCYVFPAHGSRVKSEALELEWYTDPAEEKCSYEVYQVREDSLIPLATGLSDSKLMLDHKPASAFSWAVASRTNDSLYFSGIQELYSTTEIPLPFEDGFDKFRTGETLASQTEYWEVSGFEMTPGSEPHVVADNQGSGQKYLRLPEPGIVRLPLGHLKLPYISICFSVLIPGSGSGEFRINNLNGTYLRLSWLPDGTGILYYNEKIFRTFTIPVDQWIDYEFMIHARNNNLFMKMGQTFLFNEPCAFPEGVICTDNIGFSCDSKSTPGLDDRSLLIDNVRITSTAIVSGVEESLTNHPPVKVYPNPCKDRLNIEFGEPGYYPVRIADLMGRDWFHNLVYSDGLTPVQLYFPELPAGMYTLSTGTTGISSVKIIRTGSD